MTPDSSSTATDTKLVDACLPSNKGVDYQVGSGANQLATLDLVPWGSLKAGDTVRIFYSSTPYRGHILLAAQGTANAPVRVCGVKGPNGERPIISGQNAVVRRGLVYAGDLQETRAIVLIDRLGSQDWGTAFPTYIQVDGLDIRQATASYSFTNSKGVTSTYSSFGACIWIERGANITLADNIVSDCTNGIFSRSVEIGAGIATITRDIRVAGNYIYNNGVDGYEHNLYMQSLRITYEFNRIGPSRNGGAALKDRSVGAIIRYNYIQDGSRALDLVEPEDWTETAAANYPALADTFVYGNVINKNGDLGSFIHYGGDHPGSEANFRPGKLYFYNNTIYATGSTGDYDGAMIFQLSTTKQVAEIWNNVITSPQRVRIGLRATQEVDAGWTAGGDTRLGKNYIKDIWSTVGYTYSYATNPGPISGVANIISSAAVLLDTTSFVPDAGSVLIDGSTANLDAVSAHPVLYQPVTSFTEARPTFGPIVRKVSGSAMDLGAIER
tara:strand:- start:16942 stop:18435 length:1494 start_codon:yes stop_codon:yes gene_type:complete